MKSNNKNCLNKLRMRCNAGAMEVPRLEGDRETHRTKIHGKVRPPLLVVVATIRTLVTSAYLRSRLTFKQRR